MLSKVQEEAGNINAFQVAKAARSRTGRAVFQKEHRTEKGSEEPRGEAVVGTENREGELVIIKSKR